MKKLFLVCIAMACTMPFTAASAADLAGAHPGDSAPVVSGGSGRFDLLASLSGDARFARELEPAAGDEFSPDEQLAALSESELVLPDETLPDSDIPLTFNSKVDYFVRYFQGSGRSAFSRWLSRSERYIPMMKEVLKKEGLPEDLVYVAMIESGFTPHAYSVASAVGPWQFMSATGKRYSLRIDAWIDERRDPLKSTVAAALYLKELYGIFNKDWYLAAAGYNAGENKILRAMGMYNSNDFWQLSKGTYLKRETKDYVPKLIAAAIIAKEPAKFGFADVAYLPPIEFDTVPIASQTDLDLVARLCGVSYDTIRTLNPELRRWATPPSYPDYQLKIPKGKRELFLTAYGAVPEKERYTERIVTVRYRAGKRDTIASLAKRYGTTVEAIAEANGLKKSAKVRGKVLQIPVSTALLDGGKKAPAADTAGTEGAVKEQNRYYTVKKGDTLASVARRFNVSTRLLALWNNLRERVALKVGKRIIVAKKVDDHAAGGRS